jgi:asparagine synthase (glutamine-hydrolysing)
MPGIIGGYTKNIGSPVNDLMEKMILSMNREGLYRINRKVFEDSGVFLGRVSLGIFNEVEQPVSDHENRNSIIMHGEFYGNDSIGNDPQYFLSRYLQNGQGCLRELNGIFHGAIYNAASNELKLFNDRFGLQPLYYAMLPDGIIFAGEVKALLQEADVQRAPDYNAFADFFHFGQILGEKTLFRDIKLLPPGSILTYDLRSRRTTVTKYWDLEDAFVMKGMYDEGLDPEVVASCFVESVKQRTGNKNLLGLSLSGGLDSRGILAAMGENARGIHTYTLGLPGCADEKLAGRMSAVARTSHEFIRLDKEYLTDFEPMAMGMIELSDGMYHPHESTEMAALRYFKKAPFKILLRGHGGEIAKAALAHPVMVRPEVYNLQDGNSILEYIFKITNRVVRDLDIDSLFLAPFRDHMHESPIKSLHESCGSAANKLAPADVCIYYYINEHIRRQVVNSLAIFRTKIEVRMPYIDESLVCNILKLPVRHRNAGEIHRRIVKRCMSGLVSIPDANTGAPLDAGPLRLLVTDKVNSLLKKLSVKGFRHYTEFQRWHREGFRESSKKIIFSDRMENRNLYNMDYLRRVFDMHMSGQKDYGLLLGTVVGLELWYRAFVDR